VTPKALEAFPDSFGEIDCLLVMKARPHQEFYMTGI